MMLVKDPHNAEGLSSKEEKQGSAAREGLLGLFC